MQDQQNKHAVMVGVFVLAGLLLLVVAIFMVGDINDTFKRKIELVTLFDDVNGLEEGNNIWFSGVKIGTVSSLAFYGKSQVAVGLKIDTKHKQYIKKDSKIRISADGLIGNKILVIFGGNTRSGAVEEGDTLLVEKTFSSEEILNMFQENNKNVLAITTDFKNISKKIADGEGTIGKLLAENTLYDQLNSTTASLQNTSQRAEVLVNSLVDFSAGLNKKGTLANELTTDTTVFKSVKASVFQLKQTTDNAAAMVANLKTSSSNPNTPMGVLIQDQKAGTQLKGIIENLEGSSQKLEENMEALQHNFLLRGFFKKKAKKAKQDSLLMN
ncbi:MAG: MCE family protein [Haliscomenobacter sp.]|nr:MCE family protein [Haliscomenobacter sp.]